MRMPVLEYQHVHLAIMVASPWEAAALLQEAISNPRVILLFFNWNSIESPMLRFSCRHVQSNYLAKHISPLPRKDTAPSGWQATVSIFPRCKGHMTKHIDTELIAISSLCIAICTDAVALRICPRKSWMLC